MRNFALILLFFMLTQHCLATDADQTQDQPSDTIYKTITEDGTIIFSDTPPSDKSSEKVELNPINVQPAVKLPPPKRKRSSNTAKTPKHPFLGPVNFAIVSPANGATIPPGQRSIVLQVAIDPMPPYGHTFFIMVDGQRWDTLSSSTHIDISALERGSHSIQAILLNSQGQLLARSQIIQLYVKRPGINSPAAPTESWPRASQAPKAPTPSDPKPSTP